MGDTDRTLALTRSLLVRDLALDTGADEDTPTEEDLLRMLCDWTDYMLQQRAEALFSTLYRLDVAEDKVIQALHPASEVPPNLALARLIFERQKQRAHTKLTIRPEPLDDDEWAW